jgi:hypothetical protein
MLGRFFSYYPPVSPTKEGQKFKMHSYRAALADIHTTVLGHAFRRLVFTRKGDFLPVIYEIRRECAKVLREARARSEGREVTDYNPVCPPVEIDAEKYLRAGPRPGQPWAHAAFALGPGERASAPPPPLQLAERA